MTQVSRATHASSVATLLANNSSGDISAADLRSVITDLEDSCVWYDETTVVDDSIFRIQDNVDATKELAFEVSAITTGTTRTITMPDANVTLADIATALQSVVEDVAPQLGGNLDVNGNSIVSVSNGNISITPNGLGHISLDSLNWPKVDGTNTQVIQTNGSGQLSFVTIGGASGYAEATAYNGTGGTLTQLTPVLLQGVQGTDPALVKADSDGTGTFPVHGVVNADILDTATGTIILCGVVASCDTSSWTAGDALYVSDTGTLTNTVPTNSDDIVQEVGRVIYSHISNGQIYVQPRISGSPIIDGASQDDSNGNQVLEYGVVTSAVNHVKLTNASTGNPAQIEGGGTGSNNDRLKILRPQAEHEYNPQIGTTYTLVAADQDSIITMNNASANTLTIPVNSSVAFPIGTVITVYMLGAGVTTIEGDIGVTLSGNGGSGSNYSADIQTQYGAASIIKIATDQWMISGNIDTVAA